MTHVVYMEKPMNFASLKFSGRLRVCQSEITFYNSCRLIMASWINKSYATSCRVLNFRVIIFTHFLIKSSANQSAFSRRQTWQQPTKRSQVSNENVNEWNSLWRRRWCTCRWGRNRIRAEPSGRVPLCCRWAAIACETDNWPLHPPAPAATSPRSAPLRKNFNSFKKLSKFNERS